MRLLLPQLEDSFGVIARYLLKASLTQATDAARITTGSLQRELGVSRPTIVRFARRLGYRGFSDFKADLIRELNERASGPPSAPDHVLDRVARESRDSIDKSLRTLDRAVFDQCVNLIASAKIVIWFATGDSGFLAASADHKCVIAGIPSRAVVDPNQVPALPRQVGSSAVMVVISQSGKWSAMVNSLASCREANIPIISITSRPESILAKASDYVLTTAAPDWTLGGRPFTLRPAQAVVVDALILAAALRRGQIPVSWEDPHLWAASSHEA